ncbi:hypothetical protein [Streptomyces ficellus]|uniref:Uncharacterized protein n=1 Tax=Streptomyces ficellus TaxID=1977088 RepID=A0A6I6FGL1_9ACTN|nr:hypothetical protein [Streptomyces ficellus]QGV82231.1 hypothetical protein EIZ62_31225 [Streptomyces ficellus]
MPHDHHVRALPLSDGPAPASRRTKATELSLADEELLERYPAVRGVAERWMALRQESVNPG